MVVFLKDFELCVSALLRPTGFTIGKIKGVMVMEQFTNRG